MLGAALRNPSTPSSQTTTAVRRAVELGPDSTQTIVRGNKRYSMRSHRPLKQTGGSRVLYFIAGRPATATTGVFCQFRREGAPHLAIDRLP
jgi:hypothetical protein